MPTRKRELARAASARAAPEAAGGTPRAELVLGFYVALWDACRTIASGRLEQALAREVADARLDLLGVRVLLALLAGEQRITDLAETLVAAVPNVSRTVRELEDQGMVDRSLSTTRRGAVNIRHTERGRALARDLWRRMFDEIGAFVDGWTEAELSDGERLLSKLRL